MTALAWTARATVQESAGVLTERRFYRVEAADQQAAYAALKAGSPAEITLEGETLPRETLDVQANGDTGTHWNGTVTWTNAPDNNDGGSQNPLTRPPRYGVNSTTDTEQYFTARDTNGDTVMVTNSAGVTFDDLPERLRLSGTVTVNFTQTGQPFNWTQAVGKTNESTFTIDGAPYPALTMLLVGAQANTEWFGLTRYYDVTLEFAYKAGGWVDTFDDRGTHELIDVLDDDGQVIGRYLSPIRDAAGEVVPKPWPLDGEGRALPNADDEPAQLTFLPYDDVSFPDL